MAPECLGLSYLALLPHNDPRVRQRYPGEWVKCAFGRSINTAEASTRPLSQGLQETSVSNSLPLFSSRLPFSSAFFLSSKCQSGRHGCLARVRIYHLIVTE